MNTENKFREIRFDEPFDDQDWLDIGADLRIKIRKQFYQLKKQIEQLKAENLLLSDDRELYMRHRDILIDALRVVELHNGINAHYPIVYATVTQALSEIGEG